MVHLLFSILVIYPVSILANAMNMRLIYIIYRILLIYPMWELTGLLRDKKEAFTLKQFLVSFSIIVLGTSLIYLAGFYWLYSFVIFTGSFLPSNISVKIPIEGGAPTEILPSKIPVIIPIK